MRAPDRHPLIEERVDEWFARPFVLAYVQTCPVENLQSISRPKMDSRPKLVDLTRPLPFLYFRAQGRAHQQEIFRTRAFW